MLYTLWNIPVTSVAVREVNVSVDRKESVESSQVVSKEEESNEDRIVVEGCVILVDMSGNEALVAVDVVVVIFERESSVGLGKTKVGDVDAAGILLHIDVIVGLDWSVDPIDRVWSVVGGDILILLKDEGWDTVLELAVTAVLEEASGDLEMHSLPSVIFIDRRREVGVPVVILPPVGIVVVLVSVVLTIGKGSVVKLVNRYVGIMSEVRNVDLDTSTVDDITVWGILDTVAIGEPEGRLEKIQISMGEVVAFEIIEPEAAPEGFDGNIVPRVIVVVVFSNVCLMSTKMVGTDLEDIDNEGLSDIPKVGRIPDVEIDDIAITSPDIRAVWEAVTVDKDPGTGYGAPASILLGVSTWVVVKVGNWDSSAMGVFQEVINRDLSLLDVVLVPRTGNSTIWDVGGREVFVIENSVSVLWGEKTNDVKEGEVVLDGVHERYKTGAFTDAPFVSSAIVFSDKQVIFFVFKER